MRSLVMVVLRPMRLFWTVVEGRRFVRSGWVAMGLQEGRRAVQMAIWMDEEALGVERAAGSLHGAVDICRC